MSDLLDFPLAGCIGRPAARFDDVAEDAEREFRSRKDIGQLLVADIARLRGVVQRCFPGLPGRTVRQQHSGSRSIGQKLPECVEIVRGVEAGGHVAGKSLVKVAGERHDVEAVAVVGPDEVRVDDVVVVLPRSPDCPVETGAGLVVSDDDEHWKSGFGNVAEHCLDAQRPWSR